LAATILFSAGCRKPDSEIDHLSQVLALKPGSSVADVGAGSGEVSIAIAARVQPGGKVYATEIDPELLKKIRNGAGKVPGGIIVPVVATQHDTGLARDCCDAIFLRDVYHHLTDPIDIDRSLYIAMRPGGRLAIIDFEPTPVAGPPPPGVPSNRGGHGVPKRIVEEELTKSGFRLTDTLEWPISRTIQHYCMVFVKPPALTSRMSGTIEKERGDRSFDRLFASLTAGSYSNISTVRATSPAFIARKASFTSSSLPWRLTMSSRLMRPWR